MKVSWVLKLCSAVVTRSRINGYEKLVYSVVFMKHDRQQLSNEKLCAAVIHLKMGKKKEKKKISLTFGQQ